MPDSQYTVQWCIGLGHLNLSGLEWDKVWNSALAHTSEWPSEMEVSPETERVCSEPQTKIAELIVPCKDSCSRYLECRDKVEPE
uniref:Uncharacterized protein n=1 Tax=Oryza meridionalis TaxID=40149 RepID=A0A0E0ELQ1_9ORYZ